MREKIFCERRDYEAIANASQSKSIQGKASQILSSGVNPTREDPSTADIKRHWACQATSINIEINEYFKL